MKCTIPSYIRRIIIIVLVHRCAKYFYKHLLNIGVQANQEKHLERRSYLISGDGGMLFQMSDMPQDERSVQIYDLYLLVNSSTNSHITRSSRETLIYRTRRRSW
jgi:hypothetical protein